MTRDEIVVLAREAGFETELFNSIDGDEVVVGHITITDLLVEFANLVAEKEREKEREACALICDKYERHSDSPMNFAYNCAEAIRARSGG